VNTLFSVMPVPAATLLLILLIYLMQVVNSGFTLTSILKFRSVPGVALALMALVISASWPFVSGALGAKALFLHLRAKGILRY